MTATPEPDPPLFPDELVASAGERAVLETFLDLYRDAIVRKVRGVSEEDARRFAHKLAIPVYEVRLMGYPQRMRDYNERRKRRPDEV